MIKISLCMIVKNEEDVIGRCLDSIKDLVDEIIIVDTGSTDSTIEIVEKYTDKIYHFEWIDDFAKARNYAFSKATKDYVMWLDADDILFEKDRIQFKELKSTLDFNVDIVMMKYDVSFDENNNPTFSYYRERIFKRIKNYKWVGAIHEVINPYGNIIHSEIAISHKKLSQKDPGRNLRIFEKMISDGVILDPRQQFYYARELYYNKKYNEAIVLFNNFLNSKKGWIENCISACIDLSNCYLALDNKEDALKSLLRSFEFDTPRAEVCCEIGKNFFNKENYKIAIFWYELASNIKLNDISGGFNILDCYKYIPYIQLCVCYDKLGDIQKAIYYNNKAGDIKPNDKSFLYNKKYFENQINKYKSI